MIIPNTTIGEYWDQGLREEARLFEQSIIGDKGNKIPNEGAFEIWLGSQAKARLGSTLTESWLDKLLTVNEEMLIAKKHARLLANYNCPVLIQGSTGTGKELLAQSLHGLRIGNFVAVNCTALPDTLIESELFGHIRGAFTGALGNREGHIATSNNGTLFLDEIGDMPNNMQEKLLRVLETKKYRPLGEEKEYPSNFRLVCATNKNLLGLIEDRKFRKDLYYRLNHNIIETHELQHRPEDIELIFNHFGLVASQDEINKPWKGNVRELLNYIERCKIYS